MTTLYFLTCLMITGVLLDWAFKSRTIRCVLYVVLTATGITTCTQLREQQVWHLDGGDWGTLLVLVGYRLLFKRSRYSRDDDD
ncbi:MULTISPECIES: hypothetical protein [unclassified Pseudomonas]|uniref:hypothetical protein n=1 Tax=unclassified Pseudomonas TaxID=196821 RepID=UPI00244D4810|nr:MULTISPECIES: hypothetical protein [unclassified Pseudomonas]MDH0302441.1 hypothetical protein [Pseudomonas sp. GD04091]MDH1985675.1 hypothetical protein [Pseudomonas sp. GD03689]